MISAPFDVIKIRFQLQSQENRKYTSIVQSLKRVVKEEGVLSLWKGNLSASYLWISYMMVQFSIYGVLKRLGEKAPNPFQASPNSATGGDKAWRAFMQFLAGAGAGKKPFDTCWVLALRSIPFYFRYCVRGGNVSIRYHAHSVCSSRQRCSVQVYGLVHWPHLQNQGRSRYDLLGCILRRVVLPKPARLKISSFALYF